MPHRRMPSRGTIAAAAAGVALLSAAAGCSSSSSPSASASRTPSPTSSAINLHGHKAAGPSGIITAPASNPPSSGVPGGSEVFPHIDTKADKQLYPKLLKMAGVQHVAYYPQFDQLQVYYDSDATTAEREAVYRFVTSH